MVTPIDTAALRAQAKRYALFVPEVPLDIFYALCDGYDEAARLRGEVERLKDAARQALHFIDDLRAAQEKAYRERDAARQALADLVADLRALCDEAHPGPFDPTVRLVTTRDLRAVIDRHAPDVPMSQDKGHATTED